MNTPVSDNNKRDHEEVDSSPTGATPPTVRTKYADTEFTANLVAALSDDRVVNALRSILVKPLAEQLKVKDQQIRELNAEVASLKSDVSQLKDAVDELEQYGRRNALRVWSKEMPETAGEDTDELIRSYAKKVGVELPPDSIGRSHRVGKPRHGKIRPIIVKFTGYNIRRKLYQARKNAEGYYASEDLTRVRSNILYKARLERKFGRFKHCWTSDGRINIRLQDDTTHVITTLAQLDRLIDENPVHSPVGEPAVASSPTNASTT